MSWLFNYIHRLQQLPLDEKKRKARVIAGVLTFIVFIFWLSTLALSNDRSVTSGVNIDITPLKNIKSATGDIVNSLTNLKNSFNKMGTTTLE